MNPNQKTLSFARTFAFCGFALACTAVAQPHSPWDTSLKEHPLPISIFSDTPEGIFLSNQQRNFAFTVRLGARRDQLQCSINSSLWSCSVFRSKGNEALAVVILERKSPAMANTMGAGLPEAGILTLTLNAITEESTSTAQITIRTPSSPPRPLRRAELTITRMDDETAREEPQGAIPSSSQERSPQSTTKAYTCSRSTVASSTGPRDPEVLWMDQSGRLISYGRNPQLLASAIPPKTQSLRCITFEAHHRRISHFQTEAQPSREEFPPQSRENEKTTMPDPAEPLGTLSFGASEEYSLNNILRPARAGQQDWIIWNSREVLQSLRLKSLDPLTGQVSLKCFAGNFNRDLYLPNSVCSPAPVRRDLTSRDGILDVEIRLKPQEVEALWEVAENLGPLDRYSPRILSLRVLATAGYQQFFGDFKVLILRTNFAPTLHVGALSESGLSIHVQDPDQDHLIASVHRSDQKPWQLPEAKLWSTWKGGGPSTSRHHQLDFKFDPHPLPLNDCKITVSDGVLISSQDCQVSETNSSSKHHITESSETKTDSIPSAHSTPHSRSVTSTAPRWIRLPSGSPRSSQPPSFFVQMAAAPNGIPSRTTLDRFPPSKESRSSFCQGKQSTCELVPNRNGVFEFRPKSPFYGQSWLAGVTSKDRNFHLSFIEHFGENQLPTGGQVSAKELAAQVALRIQPPRKGGDLQPSAKRNADIVGFEILCFSSPAHSQICRDVENMLNSSNSLASHVSFEAVPEIAGASIILAILEHPKKQVSVGGAQETPSHSSQSEGLRSNSRSWMIFQDLDRENQGSFPNAEDPR